MHFQTVSTKLLQERDIDTSPVSVGRVSSAFIGDDGLLRFKVEIKQPDDSILVEIITFNRTETQKIRSVLGKG